LRWRRTSGCGQSRSFARVIGWTFEHPHPSCNDRSPADHAGDPQRLPLLGRRVRPDQPLRWPATIFGPRTSYLIADRRATPRTACPAKAETFQKLALTLGETRCVAPAAFGAASGNRSRGSVVYVSKGAQTAHDV
jgi:hypothetical protein